MINIVGCDEGPEVDAARQLHAAVLKAWPWVEADENAIIHFVPNVQCHGEIIRDLDLVVLASLPVEKAAFSPSIPLKLPNGNVVDVDKVQVASLCFIIEIKDHAPQDVRFSGTKAEVRYRSGRAGESWHSASQQSEKQKYSLRNYLARHLPGSEVPYITNLLWLRNIPRDVLPNGTHNILPATLTWTGLLSVAAANSGVRHGSAGVTFTATRSETKFPFAKARDLLARRIRPTDLDRRRMDRIANAGIKEEWLECLGKRQMVFEGRGGTGKTMILLGLAWRLHRQHSSRVLVMTYNVALVADVKRLLTLMGLTDDVGTPVIEVQTVHAFFHRLLKTLGLLAPGESDFLERYDEYKAELLELLRAQVLTSEEMRRVLEKDPEWLNWDYVFIDEAQDWPPDERDILHELYPPSCFVIADGHDQLVRREANCDWADGLQPISSKRIVLERGLRMKANLARFANSLAEILELATWDVGQNVEAVGGKVIIIEGNYAAARQLHERILSASRAAGNAPVDLLTCVPPSLAVRDNDGRQSTVAALYADWGFEVWDGVSDEIRRTYPMSTEQLRIVQYESCRGLEGWAVVNLGLDEFYEHKVATWSPPDNFVLPPTIEEIALARKAAARWLMIPCSRAIDTLVLHIVTRDSVVGGALREACVRCQDFVEWIRV